MSEQIFNTRIVHKHDTEANWNKAVNFIPKQGELIVYDPDNTHDYTRTKVGDGISNVSALPFSYQAAVIAAEKLIENNAVKFVSQDLTDSQKTQARENIGAVSFTEVESMIQEITIEEIDEICGASIYAVEEALF